MLVSKFGRMGIKKVEMIKTRMNKKIKSLKILEVKEKSDCRTKNFIYNNIVLFILNATVPFLY